MTQAPWLLPINIPSLLCLLRSPQKVKRGMKNCIGFFQAQFGSYLNLLYPHSICQTSNKHTQGKDARMPSARCHQLGGDQPLQVKAVFVVIISKRNHGRSDSLWRQAEYATCGNLGKLFLFSKSQCAHLQRGGNDRNLVELFSGISTCPSDSEFLRGNVSYG